MKKKHPIDVLRDSAGSMTIGTADDKSAITGMLTFTDKLFIVKEKGIYQVQMADDFDPDRTNPSIPNAQKLVLKHGSKSEFVGRTLLLGDQLLKEIYLRNNVKRDRIMPQILELTQKLSLMNDIAREHKRQERRAIRQIEKAGVRSETDDTAFHLPQIPSLSENLTTFFINAKFALQCLLDIAYDIYGPHLKKSYFTSLIKFARDEYGKDDNFYEFLNNQKDFCENVRKIRNCLEHPKPSEKIDIHNTTMNADGEVLLPHFYVIHPDYRNEPHSVTHTFDHFFKTLMFFSEAFIGHIVGKHIDATKIKPFPIGIIGLPKNRRRYPYVEYSLGAFDGKNYIVVG